jgi:tripartite-type tricarboxylate transporter receptor subunit TctC
MNKHVLAGGAVVAAVSLSAVSALSQENLYKGAQITFIVSADAGNSYDMFGRMIARHLPKHIPGKPNIIVQNMPGAGGMRATNWLYNVAPKDGNTIGMINNTLPFDPLYGNKQAQFDASKFNWLGSPSKENALLIVYHTVPVKTLEDARSQELVLSATGAGSTPAFFARVLSSLFDFKVKIIPGYKSQTESFLAMERGENDGNASPFWSSLNSEFPQWIEQKKIRPLVYYGALRVPEIPAPHVLDLLKDAEKRAVMEIAQAGLGMGRPTLAPPGVDPAKVAVLRNAMSATFADAEYKAECAKARLNCASPSSGEELAQLVQKIYASPKSAVEQISAIYMQGQGAK